MKITQHSIETTSPTNIIVAPGKPIELVFTDYKSFASMNDLNPEPDINLGLIYMETGGDAMYVLQVRPVLLGVEFELEEKINHYQEKARGKWNYLGAVNEYAYFWRIDK